MMTCLWYPLLVVVAVVEVVEVEVAVVDVAAVVAKADWLGGEPPQWRLRPLCPRGEHLCHPCSHSPRVLSVANATREHTVSLYKGYWGGCRSAAPRGHGLRMLLWSADWSRWWPGGICGRPPLCWVCWI